MNFYGIVSLKFRIGDDRVEADYTFEDPLGRCTPRDVEAAASLALAMFSGARLSVTVRDALVLEISANDIDPGGEYRERLTFIRDYAHDFDRLQTHLGHDHHLPDASGGERELVRNLLLAIEGKEAFLPGYNSFTVTVERVDDNQTFDRQILGGEPAGYAAEGLDEDQPVPVGDVTLRIPGLLVWHPNMAPEATEAELVDLRRRHELGELVTLTLVSQDGTDLRLAVLAQEQEDASSEHEREPA